MGKNLDRLVRFANRIERKIFITKLADGEGNNNITLKEIEIHAKPLPEGWSLSNVPNYINWIVTPKGTLIKDYPVNKDTEIRSAGRARALTDLWSRHDEWLKKLNNSEVKKLPTSDLFIKSVDNDEFTISDYDTSLKYIDGLLKSYVPRLDKSEQQEAVTDLNNDKNKFQKYWYEAFPDFDEIVNGTPAASRSGGGRQKYPEIDSKVQEKLNKFNLPGVSKLNPDGKRGPLTNAALKAYCNKNNIQNINLNDPGADLEDLYNRILKDPKVDLGF